MNVCPNPKCQEPLEDDFDECPACLTPIHQSLTCQNCGRELKAHWQQCPKCKTLTASASRNRIPAQRPTGLQVHTPGGVEPSSAVNLNLPVGAVLANRYQLERKLGEGGYGVVYQAVDTFISNKKVAVKLLFLGSDAALRSAFQEYEARKRIRSFEYVLMGDQPQPFKHLQQELVLYPMDLAEGGNLRQQMYHLAEIEGMAQREQAILKLFRQMCLGVQACHEAGIIHLDLKPENFLFHEDKLKVTDFGISRSLVLRAHQRVDAVSEGAGTGPYMAPEQHETANPLDLDERADIYALGVILYEMLSGGKRPYEGNHLARKKREYQPKRLELVSSQLMNIVLSCLSPSEADRFHSVQALLDAISTPVELQAANSEQTTNTSLSQSLHWLERLVDSANDTVTAELAALERELLHLAE